MPDISVDRAVKDEAQQLFDSVSRIWPEQAMVPVKDDIKYGQYAEVVMNIIAISFTENLDLPRQELSRINKLISMMNLQDDVCEMMKFLEKEGCWIVDHNKGISAFLA